MNYFLLFLILLFSSCSKRNKSQKCQLTIAIPSDPCSLNPAKGSDPYSCVLHFALFEGLTRFAKNKPFELALAKSIEISKDQKTYIFHLKKSFWSNGKPLTAQDFYDSWSKTLDPNFPSPNSHLFYPILNAKKVKAGLLPKSALGIKIIDNQTFQVTLKKPTRYFLKLIAFCCFSPHYEKQMDNKHDSLIGNGPFVLDSYIFKNRLILKKNIHYHNAKNVALESVKINIISDENTALNMFYKGKLDILGASLTNYPDESRHHLEEIGHIQSHPVASTSFYAFNTQVFPFSNKNLRKALLLTTNKEVLAEHIVGTRGKIAQNITPTILLPCNSTDAYAFNPKLANEYLTKALKELNTDKKKLSSICLYFQNKGIEKRKALLLQQHWKQFLDLDIRIEECETNVLMEHLLKKNYNIALCSLVSQFDDPIEVLSRFKHKTNPKNYPGFENREYKDLLKAAAPLEETQRNKLLVKAQEILRNEAVFGPLYHFNFSFITQPKIKTFFLSKIGSIHLDSITINHSQKVLENENVRCHD